MAYGKSKNYRVDYFEGKGGALKGSIHWYLWANCIIHLAHNGSSNRSSGYLVKPKDGLNITLEPAPGSSLTRKWYIVCSTEKECGEWVMAPRYDIP